MKSKLFFIIYLNELFFIQYVTVTYDNYITRHKNDLFN